MCCEGVTAFKMDLSKTLKCSAVSKLSGKLGRPGKSNILRQNKRIIYNVYTFFKNLSENPEEAESINFHKAQELTAKACGVHRQTVQRVCSEVFKSTSDAEIFALPVEEFRRKYQAPGAYDTFWKSSEEPGKVKNMGPATHKRMKASVSAEQFAAMGLRTGTGQKHTSGKQKQHLEPTARVDIPNTSVKEESNEAEHDDLTILP